MLPVPGERIFRPRMQGLGRLPSMPSTGTWPEGVHALWQAEKTQGGQPIGNYGEDGGMSGGGSNGGHTDNDDLNPESTHQRHVSRTTGVLPARFR